MWSQSKLDQLKAKFEGASGGDMHDPKFRAIAEKIFSEGGKRPAPILASRPCFRRLIAWWMPPPRT